jgi:hypothetical protein
MDGLQAQDVKKMSSWAERHEIQFGTFPNILALCSVDGTEEKISLRQQPVQATHYC